jgi:ribosomal protein L2
MAIKSYRPTRLRAADDGHDYSRTRGSRKALVSKPSKASGRNNTAGSQSDTIARLRVNPHIDFKRDKYDMPAPSDIEYDPNRKRFIALMDTKTAPCITLFAD